MGSGIAITRLDLTAPELRAAARRARTVSAARRMLCLAMVIEGSDRTTAAQSCGMDRQTLRDWVHRYNAEGLRGVYDLKRPGPRPKLTADQMAELGRLVEAGPDRTAHGIVRWRRVDLRDELERRFGITLHERSVGKLLAKLGYRRLSVRPRHPQTDEEAQETFKKTSPRQSPPSYRSTPKTNRSKSGSRCYEARIGQQGTLTRVWAKRGTRPRAPRDQRYEWAYIFGAVCPQRRAAAALVLPTANTEAMNLHLAEISRHVAPGAHAVLVFDSAGYHIAKDLAIPRNITLVSLPPYAPELNPVENVWEYLRGNKLAITVFNDYDDIVNKACDAWTFFANDPDRIASITTRSWAKVTS